MSGRHSGGAVGIVACLVALLGLAVAGPAVGQGDSVQEKLEQLSRLSGQERQRFLEEQAIKEGKVVMYSSDYPDLVRGWNAGFKKRYPQIDSQFIRMTTRDILQRSVSESRAGRPTTDLLHPPAVELAILQRTGMVARYVSPESANIGAEFKDPDGYWTVYWYSPAVVGFNTNSIQRADVPTRLEDLANPKLKGKLGRMSAGGRWVAGVLKARGEEGGMDIVRRIAQQDVRVYESNSALGNAVASGQVAIGFDLHVSVIAPLKAKGAPVDYVVPEPVLILPIYQVIMKDAPHPFAAALAYDWILSKEGQEIYKSMGQIGTRQDVEYPYADVMRSARTVISLSSTLLAEPDRFNKIFEDLYIRK